MWKIQEDFSEDVALALRILERVGQVEGSGRAHRFRECWDEGPQLDLPLPPQLNHPPALRFLSFSNFSPSVYHSSLGVATTGLATGSGREVLEKPGAEPCRVSVPHLEV